MFTSYVIIGLLNTLVHWVTFAIAFYVMELCQSLGNLLGFVVAVTVSFVLNSKFTFKKNPTGIRYLLFVSFMGTMTFGLGYIADSLILHPLITMVITSGLSLVLGFLYSKYVVFK